VTENGPGAVSTMDFDIIDPAAEVTIVDGTEVNFWDLTNNVRLFRGYVDSFDSEPLMPAGRRIKVGCIGVEAWLDWLKTQTEITITGGPYASVVAEPEQYLRDTIMPTMPGHPLAVVAQGTYGTRFAGLASTNTGAVPLRNGVSAYPLTIAAGASLREAIATMLNNAEAVAGTQVMVPMLATVDFDLTLRFWPDFDSSPWTPGTLFQPDDYTTLTVVDTVAGTTATTSLAYSVEFGDLAHEAVIIGFDAASSGLFNDGTGIRGRQLVVSDTAITTADLARSAASVALGNQSQDVRGTLTIENYTPAVTTVHAGSLVDLTDAPSGATGIYRIYSIGKTINQSGTQNWTVAFGGLPKSAMRLIQHNIHEPAPRPDVDDADRPSGRYTRR
jgi:hypothetical protein